jgi:hypothetical protein
MRVWRISTKQHVDVMPWPKGDNHQWDWKDTVTGEIISHEDVRWGFTEDVAKVMTVDVTNVPVSIGSKITGSIE